MTDKLALLNYLSDGDFHSGEEIATELNVSRTAIWKKIKKLNNLLPFEIQSVPSKGYKIEKPIKFLDKSEIISSLSKNIFFESGDIEILFECTSTNQYLLERIENNKVQNSLILAEKQTDGRGRRGREWVSPFASNIYMSLLWGLNISIAEMSGLSLVVAIGVAEALKKFGVKNVMLKWPNDVYVDNKKLSGVLLELRGEVNSPCKAVIGIGVNVNMPEEYGNKIDQDWVDMQSILNTNVNRNDVVSEIVNELIPRLQEFDTHGFAEFISEWNRLDLLMGKQINIEGHSTLTDGIACGVDKYGALKVEYDARIYTLYSGEISIRAL